MIIAENLIVDVTDQIYYATCQNFWSILFVDFWLEGLGSSDHM